MRAVEIRRTTVDDADALRTIRLLALKEEPDAFGSTYVESVLHPSERWREMARDWNYYLAFAEGEVIGLASGGRFDPRPETRWLYSMFVRDDHRGTGVAVSLVRTVAAWARREPVELLGLHVTTTVPRAVAFYTKLGFVADGPSEPMDRDPRLQLQVMLTDLTTNAQL